MRIVHLECKPDEALVKKLGIPARNIRHHAGKSRVYNALKEKGNAIGVVDEDPDPNPDAPKYSYERELILLGEKNGVTCYLDKKRGNTVLVLKNKLEDWVVSACNSSQIDIAKSPFTLPNNGNSLHKVINDRLPAYEKLIDSLLAKNNKSLLTLKSWLTQTDE